MINIEKQDKNSESKAEFIITIKWPNEINNDVDAYLEDPIGNLVYFRRKEDGLMHLDRDDLGFANDIIHTPTSTIKYNENREIVSIRGIIPGEYILNIHMYAMRDKKETPIEVRIDKINPFSTIYLKETELNEQGEEQTICRFVLDERGWVKSINNLEKSFTR